MVDPDILRAIEKINARIASLQSVRDRLAEEFGVDLGNPPAERSARQRTAVVSVMADSASARTSRKDVLADFLRHNGPMTRAEIVRTNVMPAGTVSFCLRDKGRFRQRSDARWEVIDNQAQLPIPEAV